MPANLKAEYINNASSTAIDVKAMADKRSRYYRQTICLVDTTNPTAGTSWVLGAPWADQAGFAAGSLLKISYMYPARNDTAGWGGLYFEPQIRYNSGSWISLGSRGYDAVMLSSVADIYATANTMLIDPGQTSAFSVGIRYYFRAYDGTVGLNNGLNHDLNVVSGTANGGLLSGNNGLQHYGHFLIEELALLGS